MAERLVVTGLGAVSALGLTAEENWTSARDGAGGIAIEPFDPGQYGPESRDFPAAMVKGDANAALEAALDRLHPQRHPAIGAAKDAAAGAVLVASLAAAAVGAMMVLSVWA